MCVTPVSMELTMTQRQSVTKKKALVYRRADRAGKCRILVELVELAGGIVTMRERRCGPR